VYDDIQQPLPNGGESATIGYQAGGFGNDVTWSLNTASSVSNGTVLSLVHCVRPVGINYCTAVPNSTGLAASISASGSQSISAMDLSFTANNVPMGTFGIFVVGSTTANVLMSGGAGTLCIGGNLERGVGGSVLFSGMSNTVTTTADPNMLTPFSAPVMPGDVRYFQYWFRDLGASSNLSDGIRVRFEL